MKSSRKWGVFMGTNYQKMYEKDFYELSKKYGVLSDKYDKVVEENKELKKENALLKDELNYLRTNIQAIIDAAVSKAVAEATAPLLVEIAELKAENAKLRNEVTRLKNQIDKDSSNSGKPPSSNGFKKVIQNNREKSGRKQGGQPGHKGYVLLAAHNPDKIIEHKKEICDCGCTLKNENYVARQELNIKVIAEITEHRYYNGKCPHCKKEYKEIIPKELNNLANYGTSIKSFITFLNNQGIVSMDRSSEFLEFVTDGKVKVSNGTIVNWNNELACKLAPVIEDIKEKLLNAEVLHVDESPIKVDGEQMYIHNASTKKYTFQDAHKKRGSEAINEIGFLKNYCGIIVNDHYLTYYNYGQGNAECNVHISRYLKNITEITKHEWANKFLDLLYTVKREKEIRQANGYDSFDDTETRNIQSEYDVILSIGKTEYKNAHHKESDERRLLARLEKYKSNHMMFATDFKVPFENNQAERDVRGVKTKQKIGKFRSLTGAKIYSIIKSAESTYKKNGINVFLAICNAFNNEPVLV
jgi:transposase-like protein/cell division protein FtsB